VIWKHMLVFIDSFVGIEYKEHAFSSLQKTCLPGSSEMNCNPILLT
jgi:hypothetical protein